MKPVEPRDHPLEVQRTRFVGPAGSGVAPLPAVLLQYEDGQEVRTEWELDFEERGAILDGARVVLTFLGVMPPCRISVEGVEGTPLECER